MDDQTFDDALRQLGHIYVARSESHPHAERVRHIGKVFVPTGDVTAFCQPSDGTETRIIGCPDLWPDSNCVKCRALEGFDQDFLTKRSLLLETVNILVDIEQMFLDTMYWNYHNPNETPVNPDPDGFLAEQWGQQVAQIEQMIARFKPTMARHENRFGWPTEITDDK